MKDLIAVIPVYNEEEIIEKVLLDWLKVFSGLNIDFEIHVYNDGSRDNTSKILDELSKKYSEIIVHHKKNSGHGPTLSRAYKENINNAQWLFQTDSDNEISPENFEKLWNKRQDADILSGKRIFKNKALIRKFITFVAAVLVKILFGRGISDVNVPFRLFNSEKFSNFVLNLPEKTIVPNIVLSGYACSKKYRIIEIPVEFTLRQTGTCSIQGLKLLKTAFGAAVNVLSYRLKDFS